MDWKIQLSELNYDNKEKVAVERILSREWLTMGETVLEFEEKFSRFLGEDVFSVAVSSATASLHLLLMAIDIGVGDEVIIPGLTFVSDANVVMQLGARPIFADANSVTDFNVSVDSIIKNVTEQTKAIIVVHFAGYPMAMQRLIDFCKLKGIFLIEDVAHAPGAELDGQRCGTFGDASFFSFFSNKNLACGEGGMVVTKNRHLAARLARLRSHGMTTLTSERHKGRSASYDVEEIGLNYRFDEIRAAIGLVQLDKLLEGNAKRKELTKHYHEQLSELELDIPFNTTPNEMSPAFHIYPILLPKGQDRLSVMRHLKVDGIQASIHYPSFASFTAYANLVSVGDLPIVDEISVRELTLPLHPRMSKTDVETVCNSLKKVIN